MPTLHSRAAASRISRASSPSPWRSLGGVEQLEGEPGDLGGVRRVLVHQLGQVEHALAAQVGQVVERAAVAALPGVEQHALAQGEVGHDQLVDPELVHHLLEDHRAGQDDVGPAGVEARAARPGPRPWARPPAPSPARRAASVVRTRLLTDRGRLPVARSAAISASVAIVPDEPTATSTSSRRTSRANGAIVDRTWRRHASTAPGWVSFPSKNRRVSRMAPSLSERDASTSPRWPDEQLGAAAADVAQQQALVVHGHGLQHAEVDEPGLLHPRDDVDVHPGLAPRPVDELVAVLRLAHGGGGHRGDRRVVHLGDLTEAVEGGDGPVDGVGAELAHVAGARAEAHHLLLPLEDLEPGTGVARGHPGDHAVHGVGADVDGGEGLARRSGGRGHAVQSGRGARWCRVVSLAMPTKPPPKRKVKGGRVTPKGGPAAAPRPDASSRYTPPVPKEYKVSPWYVPVLMFTLPRPRARGDLPQLPRRAARRHQEQLPARGPGLHPRRDHDRHPVPLAPRRGGRRASGTSPSSYTSVTLPSVIHSLWTTSRLRGRRPG